MSEQLPALQVVLPLLAAPLCFLLRNAVVVRVFAIAVTWSTFFIALRLLDRVLETGPITYAFGDWPRPLGIEYQVDITNALVLIVISMMASVVLPIGPFLGNQRAVEGRAYLFYSAFLLCLTGLLGVTITGDAFNVFVFLEISSLSTYILIALGDQRRAVMAAFSYLIVGTIGATFILIGIGMLYELTGTLNFADLASQLKSVGINRTIVAAFAFVTVGISIKLAVFPVHQWLPNAYTYAPPVVSAFLASTGTKVAYYLLLRFSFTVFGASFVFSTLGFQRILLPLSIAAMAAGSIAAIYQKGLKRLLAYSSVAQIGYMTLGLSLQSIEGLTAGLTHLFNHALMKGGLFLVAACIFHCVHSTRLENLAGLAKRMPWTCAALVIGGLGMIGVPGTAGFVSKWILVQAALEAGQSWIAIFILVSSLLSAIYVWKLVELVYFGEAPEGATHGEAPAQILIPTWILMGAVVYFGFFTEQSAGIARLAATQLFGGSP